MAKLTIFLDNTFISKSRCIKMSYSLYKRNTCSIRLPYRWQSVITEEKEFYITETNYLHYSCILRLDY